jgi:hypothetical protein
MYVLDGAFQKNKFTNFYMTGLQGNGISLGKGSADNPARAGTWFAIGY